MRRARGDQPMAIRRLRLIRAKSSQSPLPPETCQTSPPSVAEESLTARTERLTLELTRFSWLSR
ncbi:hypothetical protein D3C72_2372690 [compost metagenome]